MYNKPLSEHVYSSINLIGSLNSFNGYVKSYFFLTITDYFDKV